MEKIMIFPLNNDTELLIEELKDKENYNIVAVSSYYEDEKKLQILQKGKPFLCSSNFDKCLQDVDAVIFAENTLGYSYEGYEKRIKRAIEKQKKIYISHSLLKILKMNIESGNFQMLQRHETPGPIDVKIVREIDVPIIAVMGMGENCDKYNLQIKIRKIIEKQGYDVLAICSNVLGKYSDMEILPGFLFSSTLSFVEKVEQFNLWLYKLQEKKKADVIVLGIPSGIASFEEYETNYYSEIPLVISNATTIDNAFLTLYGNMKQNEDSMKDIHQYCMMKYSINTNNFIVSNYTFKSDFEWRKIRYYKANDINTTKMYEIEGNSDYYITGIEDDMGIEQQVSNIMSVFENNIRVI